MSKTATNTCSKCLQLKKEEDFYKYKLSKGRYAGTIKTYRTCKECISMNRRADAYGVSFEVIQKLFEEPTCDICGNSGETFKKGMHVDHCHNTGKIRGLLCHFCNVGIGVFKDDPELLLKARDYLTK